jgi:hypothetical protein
LGVSDQIANAVEMAKAHPVPVIGAGALAVGFVVARKITGGKEEEVQGVDPAPDAVVKAYANPGSSAVSTTVTPGKPNTAGDGQGSTTPPPTTPPATTTPFPLPGQVLDVNSPGPISSQAMRITAADEAAYSCDGNRYLRYGRTDKTRNKIVCVDRTTHKESGVIVRAKA